MLAITISFIEKYYGFNKQMRRPELIASVAVVLYIVFFALSPPAIIRTILDNIVGMALAVAGATYVTLYKSKIVGGLLLAALVLSMSRGGKENFDTSKGYFLKVPEQGPAVYFTPKGTNDLYTVNSCTPCGTENICNSLVMKTPAQVGGCTKKGPFNCSMITTPAAPAAPPAAPVTPAAAQTAAAITAAAVAAATGAPTPAPAIVPPTPPTAPVVIPTPPAPAPVPVQSCALEPYSNYKTSAPENFAPF